MKFAEVQKILGVLMKYEMFEIVMLIKKGPFQTIL